MKPPPDLQSPTSSLPEHGAPEHINEQIGYSERCCQRAYRSGVQERGYLRRTVRGAGTISMEVRPRRHFYACSPNEVPVTFSMATSHTIMGRRELHQPDFIKKKRGGGKPGRGWGRGLLVTWVRRKQIHVVLRRRYRRYRSSPKSRESQFADQCNRSSPVDCRVVDGIVFRQLPHRGCGIFIKCDGSVDFHWTESLNAEVYNALCGSRDGGEGLREL